MASSSNPDPIDDILGSIDDVIDAGKGSKKTRKRAEQIEKKLDKIFKNKLGKVSKFLSIFI